MRDYDNLQGFLEHVALATSIDQKWEDEKVNIMTMHAAKGLEFDVVFLPGWEEGLFPHQKSLEEKGDFALEEITFPNSLVKTFAEEYEFFKQLILEKCQNLNWIFPCTR